VDESAAGQPENRVTVGREADPRRGDERMFGVQRVRVLALVLIVLAVGCGAEPEVAVEPGRPAAAELVLAGDGELWAVDVAAERARHVEIRELAPGDAEHRVVRRGDRFVFWGYATYAAADPAGPLERIADDTWFFIPSAHPDRVWVTVLDPATPATRHALKAVREITVDGQVRSRTPSLRADGGRRAR
jgi:hypothetical protein